jgi:hypothetical protein
MAVGYTLIGTVLTLEILQSGLDFVARLLEESLWNGVAVLADSSDE